MRLIPGKTKVKIELFKGVTLGDIIVGIITLALVTLVLLSTFPFRVIIAIAILITGAWLIFRLDTEPNYVIMLNVLRYLAYPKHFWRIFTDAHLVADTRKGKKGEQWNEWFDEKVEGSEVLSVSEKIDKIKNEKKQHKEEEKLLSSSDVGDEKKNEVWKKRKEKSEAKKKNKAESRENYKKESGMEQLIPFTGIADGFVEYNGKYYGTVIEIDPVEFRFFSQHRRSNSIDSCFGQILRSVRDDYAANIIKIERPIVYDKYLEKEYDKLDELRASYENGLLTEAELQSRIEIQYDRINGVRDLCYTNRVIQPFYYLALFNIDKRQLLVDTNAALASLRQGELVVRRLTEDKELAVFLKYTNSLDFDEHEIDKIDPKDYIIWAMPESVNFNSRYARINKIVTHEMRVVKYPAVVGDAWLAGVMSIPGTKVVVKATPMDRTKSIRAIDHSLQELRGQYNNTNIDSKIIELQTHIETLSHLLATLQQDNESLLSVNIYITMYDSVRTGEIDAEAVKHSDLPVIADMKKAVRRSWQETGMRLNALDFNQIQGFIGSQVSGYDPFLKDGRGMPSSTIAAMFPWIYARVSDEGGIRLGTQDGVPVFIDFFRRDSERVNSNMVIIGKSGSGKSYGTKSILTNMASEDSKIFILDPENEYTELAHNLHGKVINVGNAKFGRLNPFHIITTLEDDEASEAETGGSFAAHLQFLEEFFKQILPDIDKEALEYLNSLVERMYMNAGITVETDLSKLTAKDYPIFDDLYDVVLEEFERTNNEYLRTMLQTLVNYVSKFAAGGRNANIWNGPSSITTDENFSVFNFQSLLANRNTTIANAQMLLVLKYIDNEIIKNRDYNRKYNLKRKVVVVIDEAHVFIDTKFPVALDFMFQLAKRIRKYNGMQIVITQNIKDFVGSEEIARKSTAIINACQYSFIFGLSPNDMDDLCKLYEKAGGINEMEQEQIVTAPRGMAFTIMSPTSRSSFMVDVPQSMVEMFEQPSYQSHYFIGEQGAVNWEDFIGNSRQIHDINAPARKDDNEFDKLYEELRESGFTFSEITAEEADSLYSDKTSEEESSGGITFDEVDTQPDEADEGITNERPHSREHHTGYPATVQPVQPAQQAVQPMLDIGAILAAVRAEVKREMSAVQAAPTAQVKRSDDPWDFDPILSEEEAAPTEMSEQPESTDEGFGGYDEDDEPDSGVYDDAENDNGFDYDDDEDEDYDLDDDNDFDDEEDDDDDYNFFDEDEDEDDDEDEYHFFDMDEEEEDEYEDDDMNSDLDRYDDYEDEEFEDDGSEDDDDGEFSFYDDESDDDEETDEYEDIRESRDYLSDHDEEALRFYNSENGSDDEVDSDYDEYEDDDEDDIDLGEDFDFEEDDDFDEDEEVISGEDDFEDNDEEGFTPKFDIMALLDEQLGSYSEMDIVERMEEIDVVTMEVTLDDLTDYIKKARKRR
ncbi:AAA-like domain-containing protein [Ruminococcus sp. YRD2003]|uniref:VirB4 family type IV secretion system protein n=1 Tax=Ruminococcus sp. YRD2003 TaxID=1452313 RepID=UPI0008BA2D7E|nr:AAA-like domain-containing protein [Ruminococcus flavefaciens]